MKVPEAEGEGEGVSVRGMPMNKLAVRPTDARLLNNLLFDRFTEWFISSWAAFNDDGVDWRARNTLCRVTRL